MRSGPDLETSFTGTTPPGTCFLGTRFLGPSFHWTRFLGTAACLAFLVGSAPFIVGPALALPEDEKAAEKPAEKKEARPAEAKEDNKQDTKDGTKDEKKDEAKDKDKGNTEAKDKPEPKAAGGALLKILKPKDAKDAGGTKEKAGDGADSKAKEAAEDAAKSDKTAKTEKGEKSARAEKSAKDASSAVEVKIDDAPAPVKEAASEKAEKKDKEKGEKTAKDEKSEKGEKTAKKDGKDAKAGAPSKKKEPEPPMFRLRDGTRLAGAPDLKALNVKTPYGKLVVPIGEVVRVRFAASEDTQLAARIAEQVKALGSEEFDKREEAMAALREVGAPALEALKRALESNDEEVKSRAEKLIGEIEETIEDVEGEDAALGPVTGEEDEVVTLKFTVRGRVEEEVFSLGTRYGALKLNRNDIVSVTFQEAPSTKATFQVPGATFAGAGKWADTKLAVAQGERLRITASGQINLENYGQTTGPEGTTNISGNQLEGHPTGALVGRIGDKGKPFLIGADFEGNANASGTLQLGVSLQNGNASGQYQVEVEKEAES